MSLWESVFHNASFQIFTVIMLMLFIIDLSTFKAGRHLDFKSSIASLGILGTFIGIAQGLWEFNTENISASVPSLLEGLKLAFFTSIVGMGLSLLLTVLQMKPSQKTKEEMIIEQLQTLNKSLTEIHTQTTEYLQTLDKNLKEQFNAVSNTVEEICEQSNTHTHILAAILDYFNPRFIKIDSSGDALKNNALHWVAVQDNEMGLMWEMKTQDGGVQDGKHTYTWTHKNADGEIKGKENGGNCQGCSCDTQAYIDTINDMKLANYSDWRLPTIEELEILYNKYHLANQLYSFLHINIQYCSWYCSANQDSEGNVILLSLDTGLRGKSENGLSHVLLTRNISSI